MFEKYMNESSMPYRVVDFSDSSDYGPFLDAGIPANGLEAGGGCFCCVVFSFLGSSEKTVEERSIFGGLANTPYDPCYHLSCDTNENINNNALLAFSHIFAQVLQEMAAKDDLNAFLYP